MSTIDPQAAVAAGQDTIRAEARALEQLAEALAGALNEPFVHAARLLAQTKGRVIVSGMGKSGHIARKIAATLASTGTPAQFVHPAEASHGYLGMIVEADCVLAISRSGETAELSDLLYHCRRIHVPIIGMTFKPGSSLAKASTAALVLPDLGEASEEAPAPTISTTMCLALGDALAVALIKAQGFNAEKFGAIHPGGLRTQKGRGAFGRALAVGGALGNRLYGCDYGSRRDGADRYRSRWCAGVLSG
jgi:arabinose-5-phosphate isomerase